jgi:hypothetical protein
VGIPLLALIDYSLPTFAASWMQSPAFSICFPAFSTPLGYFLSALFHRAFLLLAAGECDKQRTHGRGCTDGSDEYHDSFLSLNVMSLGVMYRQLMPGKPFSSRRSRCRYCRLLDVDLSNRSLRKISFAVCLLAYIAGYRPAALSPAVAELGPPHP